MSAIAASSRVIAVPRTRRVVMGLLFTALGLVLWFGFGQSVEPGVTTVFGLTRGGVEAYLADWTVAARPAMLVLSLACIFLGGFGLARGFGQKTNVVLGVVSGLFVFGFLVWAAAGRSLNLAGLLNSSLDKAVPITLAALSGILCERAGVVNIAIEGMMLMGAMMGAIIGSVAQSSIAGLLGAVAAGGALGLFHGWLSIKYKANQIVSGTVINILATGLTSYISALVLQTRHELNSPPLFPGFAVPVLSKIPLVGTLLFVSNPFVYSMFLFLVVIHVALFATRWGLRVRSVGEHPKAADTLGINVFRTRYMATLLSGMMAGFAGAYYTLGSVGRFDEVMTAGRGFIGLAAMIFGNWSPFGSFGAGLLFGFADAVSSRLAILGIAIPSQFLLMMPYLATMVVLAGVVGRGQMPAADGVPYEKE
jgi:simple sugar transport system permease protein